jgi:CheY-like chemotaxis protein
MTRKALVVDSDFFFVAFLSELLDRRGYRVEKAYDGKQGIAKLDDGPFAIVFAELVMPKINGKQFFHFVRGRYKDFPCPLVALSGTMLEHMEVLDEIGADYFIAKGPLDRLSRHLEDFVARIETDREMPSGEKRVSQPGGIFPRRDALELLHILDFHSAVIESIGVGIVLLDQDTRIINANAAALLLLAAAMPEVLNRPITEMFPANRTAELVTALKTTQREPDLPHFAFFAGLQGRRLRVVVSKIRSAGAATGWVLALEGGCG